MSLKDIASRAEQAEAPKEFELPPIIPNSELQLDGDISAYYCAWTDESLANNIEALKKHIEERRLLAGYSIVVVHTTQGLKAGREDIAQVVEYQKVRQASKDPEKQARVYALRQFMAKYNSPTVKAAPQYEIEADDSMSIRQRELLASNLPTAIMSKDKDLDMIPGIHVDFDEYTQKTHPDAYGEIWIDKSTTQTLCKGNGTGFFWAQMLMGDGADSIPGLPFLATEILNRIKPTKAIEKARATLKDPKASAARKKTARANIAKRKAAKIGAVLAHHILKDCKSDKEAYKVVLECYKAHYGLRFFKFENWKGNMVEASYGTMFLEQARLLWMLRTPEDDVSNFIKERCI